MFADGKDTIASADVGTMGNSNKFNVVWIEDFLRLFIFEIAKYEDLVVSFILLRNNFRMIKKCSLNCKILGCIQFVNRLFIFLVPLAPETF